MSRLITLTTDFGLSDPFVGIMKGVILGIAPKATLIDLTHDIEPQNIQQAALVLASAAPYFPKKTIHLAVVDPGVGTSRRPILVKTEDAYYIGPDNGLFTQALSGTTTVYELTNSRYFLPDRSSTFHGRDLFAPVAAHLAEGVKPSKMGKKIGDPIRLALPRPTMEETALRGQIVYGDRFGNLTTNITRQDINRCLKGNSPVLKIGRRVLKHFVGTYGDCPKGKPGFLINSWNRVEIFVRDDNAQQLFKVKSGTPVSLRPS